jgi:two-component system, sensor histidine kinase RegB
VTQLVSPTLEPAATVINDSSSPVAASALTALCLHYFLALRSIAIAVHLLALTATAYIYATPLPWGLLLLTGFALGAYTLKSWWTLREGGTVTPERFQRQLLIDILGLSVVTGLTGGTANPFITLLMLPVIVAAATLPLRSTWVTALSAAGAYTLLMFVHLPFAPWGHHHYALSAHIWGMWLGFLLAAGLVSAFVARIGQALATHERELAVARERALESERTLALGTLAAGTAHELGSPLTTMAVLARELELATEGDPEMHRQSRQLRDEVQRCKEILARMALNAGNQSAEAGHALTLDSYLEATIDEWRRLRPEATLKVRVSGTRPAPRIVVDRTLTQALMNLLHNAADASPAGIEFEADWNNDALSVCVRDAGPGLPGELAERLGRAFISTKGPQGGMGLGLYLTRITLERIGGRLHIESLPGVGVAAHLALPLAALAVNSRNAAAA